MSPPFATAIEKAALATSAEDTDRFLMARFRNAPSSIRAAVDRERSARGLPALWPASTSRQPLTRRRESRRSAGVLCGIVAPGVSDPVVVAGEPRPVRELFDLACWRAVLDRVKAGRHVVLLDRHDGVPIASTANGSLRLDIDDRLGLRIVAELADTTTSRRLVERNSQHGLRLSAGFASLKTERRLRLGREVRAVVEAALDHVAVVGDGLKPAYPGANGVFASSAASADVRAALAEASRRAFLRLAGGR